MKFTQKIFLYKVNEDNTVTFYVKKGDNEKPDYFRSNARLPLLLELSKMEENTELLATIGVYYQKGKGLALQIVEVAWYDGV